MFVITTDSAKQNGINSHIKWNKLNMCVATARFIPLLMVLNIFLSKSLGIKLLSDVLCSDAVVKELLN